MNRVYHDFLKDMLDNARRAIRFAEDMSYEAFIRDEKSVYAVIRAVEIVGEAASKLPEDFRAKYPGLPWREIRGMRNKLVHNYFGINMEVVWQTIQEDLPALIGPLENALGQADPDQDDA
ncbi:MAG: DUF86 domain-containing protein [Anaerolineales bacterium]|nr:MAG: DUF86 domain-containing protein [Chloroflexota bacterium]MBE7433410.1 DUF86 domain-containing protein [Anaerolineales bacterium]GJQ34128.1 MAG: DUF86 domain-containing protein [Anaerolineaceae bacterium]